MSSFEVGKIIGSANTKTWAQVHVFEPPDKHKKKQFGQLFAAFSLESEAAPASSLIEIAAYGREVITRFHELYFSAAGLSSCPKRLENAFTTLKDEFSPKLTLAGVAAVALETEGKTVVYLVRLGRAQAFIWRDGTLVSLLSLSETAGLESMSGWLKTNDVLVLGTDKIFELVSQGSLQAALEADSLESSLQMLAPMVHGHEHNALSALLLLRFLGEKLETEMVGETTTTSPTEETKDQGKQKSEALIPRLSQFSQGWGQRLAGLIPHVLKRRVQSLTQKWGGKSTILIHQAEGPFRRSRKMAISVAILFLLLLTFSVGMGWRKKQTTITTKQESQVLQVVRYNLDQAKQLETLNPGRARTLLQEAQASLKKYQEEHPEGISEEAVKVSQELEQWLAKVSKEYKVNEATVFFDLSLVKDDFKAQKWGVTDDELAILGGEAVATLNLNNKQTQVIAGAETTDKALTLASVSPWAVVATPQELVVVDKAKQQLIDSQKLEEMAVTDLAGYAGNIYVLDSQHNQIWRLAGLSDGLAKPSPYLKDKVDFRQAISLTVDGSVWVLYGDGQIEKYIRGQKDAFVLAGLDKSFQEPIKIWTDENQNNLYILDRRNTRVVVFSKTGEYQAQYVWPGIAGAVDMVASEKLAKIFLLTNSKIYSLDIKP